MVDERTEQEHVDIVPVNFHQLKEGEFNGQNLVSHGEMSPAISGKIFPEILAPIGDFCAAAETSPARAHCTRGAGDASHMTKGTMAQASSQPIATAWDYPRYIF